MGLDQGNNNLYQAFLRQAHSHSDRVFFYEAKAEEIQSVTYGRALEKITALADYLGSLNLPLESRISILSENRHEWIVCYLAVVSLGHIAVPLDPQMTLKEWVPVLQHSDSQLLFHSEKFKTPLLPLSESRPAFKTVSFGDEFEALLNSQNRLESTAKPKVDKSNIATLVYTSGTTGIPKGVLLSHGNLLSSAQEMECHYPRSGGISASILPFNHIFGFSAMFSRILLGDSFLIFSEIKESTLFGGMAKLRPYTLAAVPLLYERFARSIQQKLKESMPSFLFRWIEKSSAGSWGEHASSWLFFKKILFAKVRRAFGGRITSFGCGGAAIDPALVRFFNVLGLPICQGYGLTETSPLVSIIRHQADRLGSVGKVIAGVEVKIADPNPEGIGEILVRGESVMRGYFKNPEATAQVIDTYGWFKTGDLGRLDEDGYLFICGRLKEVIVTPNGKNIYPAELEPLFEKLPGVREICLFGIPQKTGQGETVHLQIVLDPELAATKGSDVLVTEIKEEIAKLSQTLPEYQRPRSVDFSKTPFPRSASYKIKKAQVKAEWLDKIAQQESQPVVATTSAPDPLLQSDIGQLVQRRLKSILPHPIPIRSTSSLELDLGLDSLTQIEFWASIEKDMAIKIPEESLGRLKVIADIIEYLTQHSNGTQKLAEQFEAAASTHQASNDTWCEILENDAELNQKKAQAVLQSHPRIRPFFLGCFRKSFKKICGLQVEGLENLPRAGGYILAPNHECFIDNIFVASLLPKTVQKNMAVIGAKEFFDKASTRMIAKLCHTIPIDRTQVSSSVLQIGAQVLKMGKVLLIHPEGTRSPDGQLLPYKTGVALLADFAKCPIIPVHIEGAHEFWPKGAKWPQKRRSISVTFGEALFPLNGDKENLAPMQEKAQELTQRLMDQALALRAAKKMEHAR